MAAPREIPAWLAVALLVSGAPLAWYGFGHVDEWPRRGPGGGEGANHLAVLAALVGGVLLLAGVLSLLARRGSRSGE